MPRRSPICPTPRERWASTDSGGSSWAFRMPRPSSLARRERSPTCAGRCRCSEAISTMLTIREARGDDFPRVYPLLLHFQNKGLSKEHWKQLFVDHSGLQHDRYGWVLVDGEEVVGFVGTILSERTVRGEKVRLCNTSSWIV